MYHKHGTDTVQMGTADHGRHAQIVVTRRTCMTQPSPIGACLPVPLRRGWTARLPCVCSDAQAVLNCHGGGVAQGSEGDRAHVDHALALLHAQRAEARVEIGRHNPAGAPPDDAWMASHILP